MAMSEPKLEPASIQRSSVDRADGIDSRNRNTEDIDEIFKITGGPADFIANLSSDRRTLNVLEVGFGWCVTLLELAWRFREQDIAFFGIDIEPKPELATPEGIIAFARERGIFQDVKGAELKVPILDFYDASTLKFDDESMDFVYSAVTIRFMKKKIEFIEEVARVLRPGGQALLHLGESNWNYPYGRVSNGRVLTSFTSRLILKYGDELIPLSKYFKLFEGNGFTFSFPENSRCILVMAKQESGKLDLGLALNDELTLPGRAVPLLNRKGEVRGGMRSVYDVRADNYRALFDKGLLSVPLAGD
jgi:ubiquinone/menaquinone biosynthesis C-methylase UbiE